MFYRFVPFGELVDNAFSSDCVLLEAVGLLHEARSVLAEAVMSGDCCWLTGAGPSK